MKKQSFLSSIILIAVLMISVLGFHVWTAQGAKVQGTSINIVNPLTGDNSFNFTDAEMKVGDTFVVNLTIVDVTDLYTWQTGIAWNPSLLDFVSFELPSDNVFANLTPVSAYSNGSGYVACSAGVGPGISDTFNGTGNLGQLTMKIMQALSYSVPEVTCNLTFENLGTDTYLLDSQLNFIPFVVFGGVYDYRHPPTTTYLKIVNPLTGDQWFNFNMLQTNVGDTFVVNVTVVNAYYLDVWQIKLTWDPSLIAFVTAGFPSDNVFGTWGFGDLALETGDLVIGAATLPTGPGGRTFSGNGTLCQITFRVASAPGELIHEISCDLGFADMDCNPHTSPNPQPSTFLCTGYVADVEFVALQGSYNYGRGPYTPDIAINSVTPPKTIVGKGYSANVTSELSNLGPFAEACGVTAYSNTTSIASFTNIIVENGSSTDMTFLWNTTDFAYGNYTLSACADPLPDEMDVSNNNCTSTIPVHVGVPGDVSSTTPGVYDGVTNMKDIAYLVSLFYTKPNSPNWNPNADVNNDGVCNMKDIAIAVLHFNQHE